MTAITRTDLVRLIHMKRRRELVTLGFEPAEALGLTYVRWLYERGFLGGPKDDGEKS